jgi:hypothetical protein
MIAALRSSWTMTLVRRTQGADHPLDAVAAVCSASKTIAPSLVFEHVVDGDRMVPIVPTPAELRAHAARQPDAFTRRIVSPLTLSTAGEHPVALSYNRDPVRAPSEDLVRITVAVDTLAPTLLWRWLALAAVAYDAEVAWLDTYALRVLANERRRRLDLESEDPLVQQHPALADQFSRGVVLDGDRTVIPETVWWANVWSGAVVSRIGRARIEAAPWHAIEPAGDGLLLVATDEAPDPAHPAALEAIGEILERLALPAT